MDPNTTLARIHELITDARHANTLEARHDAGLDLAEAVEDLDDWLSKGGFLPAAWNLSATGTVRSRFDRVPPVVGAPPHLADRITTNPDVMGGVPCIRGMRLPVTTVIEMLGTGMTTAEIIETLPDLQPADIEAAVRYDPTGVG